MRDLNTHLLTEDQFTLLCQEEHLTVIKRTGYGAPRILETVNGEIIKIFYPRKKRWLKLSQRPARRFIDHANQLAEACVPAPKILTYMQCPALDIDVVVYTKMIGNDLREEVEQKNIETIDLFIQFLAELHQKGIFFRGVHLGNVIYQNEKNFALIDIADVRFKNRPLSFYLRYRNLKHLLICQYDQPFWQMYTLQRVIDHYLAVWQAPLFLKSLVAKWLMKVYKKN